MPYLNDEALRNSYDDSYPNMLSWGPGTTSNPEYDADQFVAYVSLVHLSGSTGLVNQWNMNVVRGSPEFLTRSNWPLYNQACLYAPSEGPGGCSHPIECACVPALAPDAYLVVDTLNFVTVAELAVMAERAASDDFLYAAHPRLRVGFGSQGPLVVYQVSPYQERWCGPVDEVRSDTSWLASGGVVVRDDLCISWTRVSLSTQMRDIYVFTRHGAPRVFRSVPEWARTTRVLSKFQSMQVLTRGPITLMEVVSPNSGLLGWIRAVWRWWIAGEERWVVVPSEIISKARTVMALAPRTQGTLGHLTLLLKAECHTLKVPPHLIPSLVSTVIAYVFPDMDNDLETISFVDRARFQRQRLQLSEDLAVVRPPGRRWPLYAAAGALLALYWLRPRAQPMRADVQAAYDAAVQTVGGFLDRVRAAYVSTRECGRLQAVSDSARALWGRAAAVVKTTDESVRRSLSPRMENARLQVWATASRLVGPSQRRVLEAAKDAAGEETCSLTPRVRRHLESLRLLWAKTLLSPVPAAKETARAFAARVDKWKTAATSLIRWVSNPRAAIMSVPGCWSAFCTALQHPTGRYVVLWAPFIEEVAKRGWLMLGFPPWFVAAAYGVMDGHDVAGTVQNSFLHWLFLAKLPFPLAVVAHASNNFWALSSMAMPRRLMFVVAAALFYLWWIRRGSGRGGGDPESMHPFFEARASTHSGTNLVKRMKADVVGALAEKAGSWIDSSLARPENPYPFLRPTAVNGPRCPSHPSAVFAGSAHNELQAIRSRVQQELVAAGERTNSRRWFDFAKARFAWPRHVRRITFEDWNRSFPAARQAQHVRAYETLQLAIAAGPIGGPGFQRVIRPRVKAFVKAEPAAVKDGMVPRLIQAWDFPGQVAAGPFVRAYCQELREQVLNTSLDAAFFWAAGASASAEDVGDWFAERFVYLERRMGCTLRWLQVVASGAGLAPLPDELWFHIAAFLDGRSFIASMAVETVEVGAGMMYPEYAAVEARPRLFRGSHITQLHQWYSPTDIVVACGDASRYDSTCDTLDTDFKRWLFARGGGGPLLDWAYGSYPAAPRTTANGIRYSTPYDLLSGEPGTSLHATVCLGTKIIWALENQGVVATGPAEARQAFLIQNGDDHNIVTRNGIVDYARLTADLRTVGVAVDYEVRHPSRLKFLSRRLYVVEDFDDPEEGRLVLGPLAGRQIPKMFHTPRPLKALQRRRYVRDVCVGVRKAWSCIPLFDQYLHAVEQACGDPRDLVGVRRAAGLWQDHEYGIRNRRYHRPFMPETQFHAIYGEMGMMMFEGLMEAVEQDGLDADLPPASVEFFVNHDQPVRPRV